MKHTKYIVTNMESKSREDYDWIPTTWEKNEPVTKKGGIRCYESVFMALFFSTRYPDQIRVFRVDAEGIVGARDGFELYTTVTVVEEVPKKHFPSIPSAAVGIQFAKKVCKDENWNKWAEKWLDGEWRKGDYRIPRQNRINRGISDQEMEAAFSAAKNLPLGEESARYAAMAVATTSEKIDSALAAVYAVRKSGNGMSLKNIESKFLIE